MTSSLDLLLVDASPPARYALRLLLQRHGMRVRTADSAERALELIHTKAPDAVVAASVLPGMNGLELLELLKADHATARIPLVICCPNGSWPLTQTALRRGALAVLPRDRLKHEAPAVLTQIETALATTPKQAPAPGAVSRPAPAAATAPEPAPRPAPEPAAESAPAATAEPAARTQRFGALSRAWQRWRRQLHMRTIGVVLIGIGVMLLELILHRG